MFRAQSHRAFPIPAFAAFVGMFLHAAQAMAYYDCYRVLEARDPVKARPINAWIRSRLNADFDHGAGFSPRFGICVDHERGRLLFTQDWSFKEAFACLPYSFAEILTHSQDTRIYRAMTEGAEETFAFKLHESLPGWLVWSSEAAGLPANPVKMNVWLEANGPGFPPVRVRAGICQ